MNLHREIKLAEPKIVRKELDGIIQTKLFAKYNHFRECEKEILLQKWATDLSRKYSNKELKVMLSTLEKEEARDSAGISKWLGYFAVYVAVVSILINLLSFLDMKIFFKSFYAIPFLLILVMVLFYLFRTTFFFKEEFDNYKSKVIYMPIIQVALKCKCKNN